MTRRLPLFMMLAMVLPACQPRSVEQRPTTEFVSSIISDRTSPVFQLLSAYPEADRFGDIAVIGTENQCNAISVQFTMNDMFDNVDGSRSADGLADFSGEFMTSIVDDSGKGYSVLEEEQLRNLVVRSVVSAIDTTYSLTAYDLDALGRKSPAKLIILADVQQLAYGRFDVDTLLHSTGCGANVICPMEAMLDRVIAQIGRKELNLGVICSPDVKDSTIYSSVLSELLPDRKVNCYAAPVAKSDTSNVVISFLDAYIASGNTATLDALIVDDYSLPVAEISDGLRRASSLMSEESLKYGKYLVDGLRFACPAEAVCAAAYRTLREQNIFTHKISHPQVVSYRTVPRPDDKGGELLTPISFYVQD